MERTPQLKNYPHTFDCELTGNSSLPELFQDGYRGSPSRPFTFQKISF